MLGAQMSGGTYLASGVLAAMAVYLVAIADEPSGKKSSAPSAAPATNAPAAEEAIAVAPPPFSKDIFPCSDCHDGTDVNRTQRKLTDAHEDIVLHHDEQNRWCLDCHDATNRDKLHLASGKLIDFTESYKLCGQCHGPTLRNWKAGEHGKRTGEWSGRKEYLLCAHCHNPHSPRFKPLKPLPPPQRPESLK